MKKAVASLLVALLCCTFAVTAVGCSETQTAAPSLALLNESAVTYSEGGTQFSLDVRSEGLQGTITYDVIPQVDGITVDESGTVRIAAEVADGTVFTVRARSGARKNSDERMRRIKGGGTSLAGACAGRMASAP